MATFSRSPEEWVSFPTIPMINAIPAAFTFTNAYSKTVLLVADPKYVSKSIATYLDTTLHVSGFKVTKCNSITSAPLFWANDNDETENNTNVNHDDDDALWDYKLDLSDFDAVVIPSQINGNLMDALSNETKSNLQAFVNSGGSLICCHHHGTTLLNSICDTKWHEVGVRIGVSYHTMKPSTTLRYKDDVRGIVGVCSDDSIYKTRDDLITVAGKKCGDGYAYYIGHDFGAIWEKKWNSILYSAIKKRLVKDPTDDVGNLNFGEIDINIEAFKNLNIIGTEAPIAGDMKQENDDLEEFEVDFENFVISEGNDTSNKDTVRKVIDKEKEFVDINQDIAGSFDEFKDLDTFDDNEMDEMDVMNSFDSIEYIRMNEDGNLVINDNIVIEFSKDVIDKQLNAKLIGGNDNNDSKVDDDRGAVGGNDENNDKNIENVDGAGDGDNGQDFEDID